MKKFLIIFIFIAIIGLIAVNNTLAYGWGDMGSFLGSTKNETGLGEETASSIIASVINALLGLMGAIFISLIIYGGISWMISAGEQEKIQKAKKVIISAIIGVIIVSSAYTIAYFIGSAVEGGSGGTPGSTTPDVTCAEFGGLCRTHYECTHSTPPGYPLTLGSFDCSGSGVCCVGGCVGIGGVCMLTTELSACSDGGGTNTGEYDCNLSVPAESTDRFFCCYIPEP